MDDDFEPTQHFCCVVCSLVSLGFDGGPGEEDLLPMSSLELSNFEESGTAGGASFLEGRVGAPFVVAGSALSRRPWLNFRTGLVSHFRTITERMGRISRFQNPMFEQLLPRPLSLDE